MALTVASTGLLWDPGTTTYGALKGLLLPLGALTAALMAWRKVRRGDRWPLDAATLTALGLVIWAACTLLWTPSLAAGLGELAPAVAAVILLISARVLLRDARAARRLAVLVTITGLLVSASAFVEHALGRTVITGTIGNPNHLAAYLAITMPFAGWVAWSWPSRASARHQAPAPMICRALRLVALTGPILGALALTGCRSAWLALVTGGLVAVALTRPTRRGRGLALGSTLLLLAATAMLLAGAPPRGPQAWRKSLRGRLYLARISASMLAARPVIGQGVGAYALRFPVHQAVRLTDHPRQRPLWTHAQTAHCEPLQGVVELGLPGGLLLLLLTVLVLRAMVGSRGRGPPPIPQRTGAVSLAILAVTALAEGSLHNVALLTLATVAAALLLRPVRAAASPPGGLRGHPLRQATWVAGVLAFTASALTVTAARHYVADRLLARAHLSRHPRERLRLLQRASRLAPNPGRARFYLALTLAAGGHPAAAQRTLRLSARDFANLGTTVAEGNTLMAQGRHREAARAYRRATWLHPRYAAAHHNLGVALHRMGQRRAAQQSLRRARRLWPGRWLEPWRIRVIRRHTRSR